MGKDIVILININNEKILNIKDYINNLNTFELLCKISYRIAKNINNPIFDVNKSLMLEIDNIENNLMQNNIYNYVNIDLNMYYVVLKELVSYFAIIINRYNLDINSHLVKIENNNFVIKIEKDEIWNLR